MKQKQSQSLDFFLSDLCLALLECQFGTALACEQLKDQFPFYVAIHDVQDNLLRTIKKDEGIKNVFMKQGS